MALKMKISEFSVNKHKSSITVDFLGLVLFSRGSCLTPNTHTFFGLTYVTNKFIINLKWRKCKDLFKSSIKGNIKIQNSTSFQLQFNYCIHNENEIRGFLKIRMKSKKTNWNWNMKDKAMARYCHNSTFLKGVSLELHEEFQIILSLCVQFSQSVVSV